MAYAIIYCIPPSKMHNFNAYMGNEKPKRVQPQVLKGFRDYPPREQLAREEMLSNVRSVVETMGFLPLQTPALELAQTLLGPQYSKDSLQELFGFEGPDDIAMALRYEFTVSLARYVASQPNLALPFRRYQYGNVWRVDKPGPGRYREFMQFDIDIVGTTNLLADAEIIAAMVGIFKSLHIERFVVRISNRKILNGLMKWAGVADAQAPDVMRVIDKLEKQGKESVLLELGPGRVDSSGDKVSGLNLPDSRIDRIREYLELAMVEHGEPLQAVSHLVSGEEATETGVRELMKIRELLNALGVKKELVKVDLTVVRGLGYYTGPVFETTLLDLPEFGSVFSGGRYDNLVNRFSSQQLPAVGASIGIDRLLAALLELKTLPLREATSQVLVTVMDAERLSDYLAIVRKLRDAGIACEIYSGDTKNLTKQIRYGDKVGIPFAVIAGSDEFAANKLTIKNLAAGKQKAQQSENREEWLAAEGIQETIEQSNLVDYLRSRLT